MFALLYLEVHQDSDFKGSCGRVGVLGVLVVGFGGWPLFGGGAVLPCRQVLRLLRSRTQPRSFGSCYDGYGEDGPLISGFSYDVSLSLS